MPINFFFFTDSQVNQGRAAAFQRGGGDAKRAAASKHCALPRLLEVDNEGP